MKFFTKSRYALRVMIELARHPREQSIPLKYLAEKQNISLKYLEQIIVPLSRAGLVRSERGSQGGYRLALEPEQCTAGHVLRAIEGSLAPVECLDPSGTPCSFRDKCPSVEFWRGMGACIDSYADGVTLAQLASSYPPCANLAQE
ncbi:MAG: Rrf2 family transcriptional regulator [Mailhella sp.]|nr:Rrf2 family transcriptional regulator [Mailhella sp.]MBQ9105200.1 Rrf2 family transcriptional regulator [Mailhella sp.]